VHDGTLLYTFIDQITTGMCHVTIPKEFVSNPTLRTT